MNQSLTPQKFAQFIVSRTVRPDLGMVWIVFRFPNGHGASLALGLRGHGSAEIALLTFEADDKWSVAYDGDMFTDVVNCYNSSDMGEALAYIMAK